MTLWFCRKTSYQYGCCRPEPLCYLATVEKMTHLVDRVPSHVPACCFLCVEVCRGFEQRSQVFFSSTGIGSNNAIKGYIARFHPKLERMVHMYDKFEGFPLYRRIVWFDFI